MLSRRKKTLVSVANTFFSLICSFVGKSTALCLGDPHYDCETVLRAQQFSSGRGKYGRTPPNVLAGEVSFDDMLTRDVDSAGFPIVSPEFRGKRHGFTVAARYNGGELACDRFIGRDIASQVCTSLFKWRALTAGLLNPVNSNSKHI